MIRAAALALRRPRRRRASVAWPTARRLLHQPHNVVHTGRRRSRPHRPPTLAGRSRPWADGGSPALQLLELALHGLGVAGAALVVQAPQLRRQHAVAQVEALTARHRLVQPFIRLQDRLGTAARVGQVRGADRQFRPCSAHAWCPGLSVRPPDATPASVRLFLEQTCVEVFAPVAGRYHD